MVVGGFVALTAGFGSSGSWARLLRLFKCVKTLRVLKCMRQVPQMRALMICLYGSLTSLFWCMVSLFTVYLISSLGFLQLVAYHLDKTGEALEDSKFSGFFGSVEESILTLYKASTGGDDWSLAYHVIQPTGYGGCAGYLFFIAFVQFAIINIITGIFVESAMKTLSPDSERLALNHSRIEHENARKLIQLCVNVDADCTGKLTREQFEDGLRRKQIPQLLEMLGLQQHHVLEFFSHMAKIANDHGQVKIEKFVNGCMLLKGAATNFDLQKMHAAVREIEAKHRHTHTCLNKIMKLLGGDILEDDMPYTVSRD